MTKKAILKRANQICDMLNKLQGKAKELAMKIRNEYGEDDLEELEDVLFDLYNFDLEDVIITAYDHIKIIEENKKNGIHVQILPRC